MRGKTDSEIIQENMCLENTTYYSDPEKWLPTQQGFQLKEASKTLPHLQNTRSGKFKMEPLVQTKVSDNIIQF